MSKKQTTVRLDTDTIAMIHKLAERNGKSLTQVLSEAVLVAWMITGGGKYEIDMEQTEALLNRAGAID